MKLDPEELAQLELDPKREAAVLAWLRQQDEVIKFEFAWRALRANTGIGLSLVKQSQLKPVFLEVILEHGFVYADASGIRFWLEAVVASLGHQRLVSLVRNHLRDAPLVVDKCLYWLPVVSESQSTACEDIRNLRDDFQRQYPNFQSTRSTGIHATKA